MTRRSSSAVILATVLTLGARAGQAQTGVPAAPPALPPGQSQGFRATSPRAVPGQTLVPPPQAASGGVITPPTAIDRGIARPTPPASAFPTPVIRPDAAPKPDATAKPPG